MTADSLDHRSKDVKGNRATLWGDDDSNDDGACLVACVH